MPENSPPEPAAPGLPKDFGFYRIEKQLGKGSMGSVFLATDSRLNRPVALKVCDLGHQANGLERFQREAKAAAALRHPNLCPVYDCGVYEGISYFTMAFIEGPTLREWVDRRGGVTPQESVRLAGKLALALAVAHEKGIVHRDLKPSNIAMEKEEPIVLDFGLAHYTEVDEPTLTKSGCIVGTPSYMAPEQVAGNTPEIGPGTDVYALGVILYELLTGRRPFTGTTAAVLGYILFKEPPALRELRPDVDPRLEQICLKALAKQPAARWPSMLDFAKALREWLRKDTTAGSLAKVPALKEPVPAEGNELLTRTVPEVANVASTRPAQEIRVNCPHCGRAIMLLDSELSLLIECAGCDEKFYAMMPAGLSDADRTSPPASNTHLSGPVQACSPAADEVPLWQPPPSHIGRRPRKKKKKRDWVPVIVGVVLSLVVFFGFGVGIIVLFKSGVFSSKRPASTGPGPENIAPPKSPSSVSRPAKATDTPRTSHEPPTDEPPEPADVPVPSKRIDIGSPTPGSKAIGERPRRVP